MLQHKPHHQKTLRVKDTLRLSPTKFNSVVLHKTFHQAANRVFMRLPEPLNFIGASNALKNSFLGDETFLIRCLFLHQFH